MIFDIKKITSALIVSIILVTGCNKNSVEKENISEQEILNIEQENIAKQEILNIEQETLDIMVSIAPQKYFVEKIGGDRVNINIMVEGNSEPETYEPKPQQLQSLEETEVYISIGVPFEDKWLEKFADINDQMAIIDSGKGIERLEMIEHDSDHHHHGEDNLDPHIWLSPSLVKQQAQNIYENLILLDEDNKDFYQENLEQFLTEIEELDQEIKNTLKDIKNRKFVVFHPAWGYFANDYNLEQIPIEVGGQEPSAAELSQLINTAKNNNIKVVFVQPQFKMKNAETIAQEINGEIIIIDPLALNWSENLLNISQTFNSNL